MQFSPEHQPGGWTESSVARGLLVGTFAVLAIGVWAISLESLFADEGPTNAPWLLVKVFLCEAIPLAALVALHRGIERKTGLGEIFCDALRSALFFLPRPRKQHEER